MEPATGPGGRDLTAKQRDLRLPASPKILSDCCGGAGCCEALVAAPLRLPTVQLWRPSAGPRWSDLTAEQPTWRRKGNLKPAWMRKNTWRARQLRKPDAELRWAICPRCSCGNRP